jgi:hypothetical protein
MPEFYLLLLFLSAASAGAHDTAGQVFFGQNLAKAFCEHTDRVYLKIDDSEKLYFNRDHDGPVVDNLNPKVDHVVTVYFDDQVAQSWIFNFAELKTQRVVIWRAAGAWRMEPCDAWGVP